MPMTFLVAEESSDTAHGIEFSAQMSWPGCRVITAGTGEEAIARFAEVPADAVLLDVQLEPSDGFEVCRQIREMSNVPIVMLSADDAIVDKIRAFDLGADDYLVKPFDHLELMARLRALLRRAEMGSAHAIGEYACGDLAIDFGLHMVRCHGEEVRLTSTEFRLLEVLVRNAGMTMPHHVRSTGSGDQNGVAVRATSRCSSAACVKSWTTTPSDPATSKPSGAPATASSRTRCNAFHSVEVELNGGSGAVGGRGGLGAGRRSAGTRRG